MRFISELYRMISFEVREFFSIDWTGVQFERWETALMLAGVLVAVLAFRLIKKKDVFRFQSGLQVFKGDTGGLFIGLLKFLSRLGLVAATSLVLLAIADPFVTSITEQQTIRQREVIFLFDTSGSMARKLSNTQYRNEDGYYERGADIAKAIMGREGVLHFLDQREGKNERYSLWLFSSNVYHFQRWIDDFYEFEYKVYSAPHVVMGKRSSARGASNPDLRVWRLAGDAGSTNIKKALRAIVNDISKGGREDVKRRALIMVTDVELGFGGNEDPGAELRALNEMGVVPYVVITSANGEFNSRNQEFLNIVRSLGGKAYPADDLERMKEIFDEINDLEVVEETVEVERFRVRLYPKPLFLALVLFLASLTIGVVADGFEIP